MVDYVFERHLSGLMRERAAAHDEAMGGET